MKKVTILGTAFGLLLSFILAPLGVIAAETSGSASVDVMSNYVWRGQKLSNSLVVQPSTGITYGGFGANLWANYDTGTNEHNETDLTLNFSNSVDKFSYDVGYIFYALDGSGDDGSGNDTQEIYLTVGYDVMLSPSLTVYLDFDEGDGAFVVASISHTFELPEKLSVDLGASVSYDAENAVMGTDADGDDINAFYNGDISASLSIPVTDAISVAPMIAYSFPLSNDAEDAIEAISDDGDGDIVYGGINISLSF
ncbi:MAG: hypothetical protein AMK71_02540 [Nitrospira bacterium SG8_35_4]|nr:MAG: hypothetical protein AMK71_02540 [Nitrospira bacterium SG8_35_4]